jgi:hypothetical protein
MSIVDGKFTSFRANEDGSVDIHLPDTFFDGPTLYLCDEETGGLVSEFENGLKKIILNLRDRKAKGPGWLT